MPTSFSIEGNVIKTGILGLIGYIVAIAMHRLYISPLAKISGPKLAALTYFYEFYYDALRHGQYLLKVKELHEKYGAMVRITPGEARHDESAFFTFDADKHRLRRAGMSGSFSKQSIRALEPTMLGIIEHTARRMESFATSGQVVNLREIYSGMTLDVIAQYCFGETTDNPTQESFGPELMVLFEKIPQQHAWGRMFPWLYDMLGKIPMSIVVHLDQRFKPLVKYSDKIGGQISGVPAKDRPDRLCTVLHESQDSKQLPESDKTLKRFKSEVAIFLGAGVETTTASLATLSYHLASNPHQMEQLRRELADSLAENSEVPLTAAKLETLPYFTVVTQEGVRLSFGVPGRLPRVAPREELVYAGYRLPPGTVMSESSYLIHTNEEFFPDPFTIKPERRISDKININRNFVAFSRGARMCIDMNLAYAEMYLACAVVLPRFDLKLVDTTHRDVKMVHDFFTGFPCLESKGVRVSVSKRS
ncbi:putative benzoate 4-monooxygenase cytochrome P450 [Polychaeton citri CBS 116435]|uniref:Benzoate 4-monooxygenase cytochrome P450 n=1 Tax=Polychaeton citri CBS 116435 TaxID=1314669 RepID=A0A9P4UKS0_9PEZI|nr:putative benzoate 4-monooxygenase cytochrome P450 [Polychaeton citri CBS 116435]